MRGRKKQLVLIVYFLSHQQSLSPLSVCIKKIFKKSYFQVHIRLHEKGILEEGLEQKEGLEGVLEAKGGPGGESELTLSKGDPENGTKVNIKAFIVIVFTR